MLSKENIEKILKIAHEAGDAIMQYYHDYCELEIVTKSDDSPVTKADLAANKIIVEGLLALFPSTAIVSEENSEIENLAAAKNDKYFLIDPLDGTKSFIKKLDEFTVNIALIIDRKTIFGVIYAPAKDVIYFTNEKNQAIRISDFSSANQGFGVITTSKNKNNLKVICTQREPEKSQIIAALSAKNIAVSEVFSINSSYKFCLIADGFADLYPRHASISAWDIAAGHAIVKCAGGNVFKLGSESELEYKFDKDFAVPFFECY
jgi:3'(2'), 5'-bisphosphate nucleotidase